MKVLLVGNYTADGQESMQRFSALLASQLARHGVDVRIIRPDIVVNKLNFLTPPAKKWLGHVDKYVMFPFILRSLTAQADIIHICDQSNSVYLNHIQQAKTVVTCHDLLAVRGALGEDTGCHASFTGRVLQRWILRSLRKADMIVCDSENTKKDVERLTGLKSGSRVRLVHIGLNYNYRVLSARECAIRLMRVPELQSGKPFILTLGSNETRKNRAGSLRIFAKVLEKFSCLLVFAGDPLTPALRFQAASLNLSDSIIEVEKPDNQLIEALYNQAFAFLFPSIAEGFGWPVIEAQASGCPVVCSNREPLPEIAGDGALLNDTDNEEGFVKSILSLRSPGVRQSLIDRGLENTERFQTEKMTSQYIEIYTSLNDGS